MRSSRICRNCNGTGYTGLDHLDICSSCMGVGRFYNPGGLTSGKLDFRRTNAVILILGMLLVALVMASGQLKFRWLLAVGMVYLWTIFGNIGLFFISIGTGLWNIITR